ncbi:MAG TPA: hypothetical protein VEY92_05775 [Pseudoxanthomonas sp.]|nr:hypothetical protein [Pseudoxanthomonas sp.]
MNDEELTVDAALALVQRHLPEARIALTEQPDGSWRATILWRTPEFRDCPEAHAKTAPLAIASALLAALRADSQRADCQA